MAVYTVHKSPVQRNLSNELDQFIFIREGMSLAALLIAPFWLIWRNMWTVFLLYMLIAISVQIAYLYFPVPVVAGITLCLSVLFALEGNQLRRWTLSSKGWQFAGVVSGRNLEECESKFFSSQFSMHQSTPIFVGASDQVDLKTPVNDELGTRNDIVGLFPTPVAER